MPSLSRRGLAAVALTAPLFRATPVRAQTQPVRLGAVLPFSGGLELFGQQAKLGIDLAVSELNSSGGVRGRPVEVIVEDNKTDPKTSVEKATKLIGRDEVLAILGPITSSARDAMAPTMARQKTPLLYATNYEGGACGRYLFSFNTVPNQELAQLVPHLAETKGKAFFMFGADYVWPQKMFTAAETLISVAGGKVLGKEFTAFGVKDFTPIIRRIEASGANVLLFALPGADGITFIRQAEELGLLRKVTVGILGFSEAYLGAFGEGRGQDMWVTVPLVSSSSDPSVADFVSRIRAMAGPSTVVSHYVMSHYLAVKASARALEIRGEVGREVLVDGLAGLTIEGPTGSVAIGATDHHVTLPMFLARTSGAGLEVVKALGAISPEAGCG